MRRQRTANRSQRKDMILANKGQCEVCGGFGAEVHHITPYSQGGATELFNFLLLCKECHKRMHNVKPKMKLSFEPRNGQDDAWRKIPRSPEQFDLIRMPTGYGKTYTGIGIFIEMQRLGYVDKCLILVASKIQKDQWLSDINSCYDSETNRLIGGSKRLFGIEFHGEECENADWVVRESIDPNSNTTFFVATYQLVCSDIATYKRMLNNRWLVICDEAHHLAGGGDDESEGNEWSRILRFRQFRKAVYLSATPHRHDKVKLEGIKYEKTDDGERAIALVYISNKQAFEEEANRRPIGHNQHYFVDIDSDDGALRVTTEQLKQLGYSDFSDFEKAKRGLRYNDNYVSRLITDAIECYELKNAIHADQHQILFFAMTVKHAKFVSDVVNRIVGDGFSDWIGENNEKDDKTNEETLSRYNKNELPCLVQVRKAVEGFNNPRSSILVFLNLTKSSPQIQQQIGRGLRRNFGIQNFTQDVCDIFFSADTNIADEVANIEREWLEFFNSQNYKPKTPPPPGPGTQEEIYDVVDAEFYKQDDIFLESHIVIPDESMLYIEQLRKSSDANLSRFATMSHTEIYLELTGKSSRPVIENKGNGNKTRKESKSDVSTIAGRIAALFYKEFPPPRKGDGVNTSDYKRTRDTFKDIFYKKLHGRWKFVNGGNGVKGSTTDELSRRIKWYEDLEKEIKTHGVPEWLRP